MNTLSNKVDQWLKEHVPSTPQPAESKSQPTLRILATGKKKQLLDNQLWEQSEHDMTLPTQLQINCL